MQEAGERQQRNQPEMKIVGLPFIVSSGRLGRRSAFARVRKTAMMMARPTAASAAATTITKKTKICPLSVVPLMREGDEASGSRALSISSIDMKMVMILRLMRKPTTPMAEQHRAQERYQEIRNQRSWALLLLARQRDGAQDGDQDQHGGDFERQQEVVEEHTAEVGVW